MSDEVSESDADVTVPISGAVADLSAYESLALMLATELQCAAANAGRVVQMTMQQHDDTVQLQMRMGSLQLTAMAPGAELQQARCDPLLKYDIVAPAPRERTVATRY